MVYVHDMFQTPSRNRDRPMSLAWILAAIVAAFAAGLADRCAFVRRGLLKTKDSQARHAGLLCLLGRLADLLSGAGLSRSVHHHALDMGDGARPADPIALDLVAALGAERLALL